MKIYYRKYSSWVCCRLMSKRTTHIFCLLLFFFTCAIWIYFFVKIKPQSIILATTLNSSLPFDLLDTCMLDDTPCLSDIKQAIDRYFSRLKWKFPMLLTYHPTIDCENGRYLLLNNASGSYVVHGTGSKLMWYLGVLNIAHKLNLTLIHLDWNAEHAYDESNSEREKYWQFFDWEIPYSAYMACPSNSSIKRNRFQYDLMPNQTLDQHHNGKQPFTIKPIFKTQLDRFIANLQHNRNGTGFTLYSSRTITITSSLMEIGAIFETRWWLQHRKLYNQHNGVWSGISSSSNYRPKDYFQYIMSKQHILNDTRSDNAKDESMNTDVFQSIQCPPIDRHDVLLIGVHIRHGDVVKRDKQGRIVTGDLYRYMENSAYTPLIIAIVKSLPDQIRNKYLITIYSEGVINDFHDILSHLKEALPNSRCRISFFLNGRTSDTFNRLLRDDVLIGSLSTFSMATGIFNSRQLKIGPYHNRARVHGMRNHLSLNLNQNHSQFSNTEEKLRLIKQRIPYVWKQKKAQQKTPIPLWLNNYESDYPEEYMLI